MENKPEKEHLIGYDEYDQAGSQEPKKRKRKQMISMIFIVLLLVAVIAVSLGAYFFTRQSTSENGNDDFMRGNRGENTSYVSASGTTSIGMDAVVFDIDFLEDTELYVEEVYLSSGDEVTAGTKILKFTDESLEEARTELEEALQSAKLSYESSVITTQESEITLKYNYNKTILEATQAQSVYDDKVAELEAELADALEAYEEAQEDYDELNEQIINNTFYEDYEVAEKKQAYIEAEELYSERYEYWEITEDELQSATSTTSSETTTTSTNKASKLSAEEQASKQDRNWIIKTIQLLAEEVETAEAEYEQAESDYEKAVENAELNLKVLANTLEKAKNDYDEMTLKYQQDMLSAKTTYETAVANSQIAQTEYETELESLSEDLEKLKDARDEAQENLDEFEAEIGDGFLYTEEDGMILKVLVEEDQELTGSDVIMAYSKPSEISVTVSVDQDDIAQIAVKDTAHIYIDGYDTYEGVVTSIDPVSSSSSKTTVTYTVIVSVSGDVSALSENLTATVIFGDVELPTGGNGMRNNGNMPDNGEMPADGEMPSGMEMPSDGEMPSGNMQGGQGMPSDMTGGENMGETQNE